jgi:uncharacterized membrane protein (DUF106 family)
MKEVKGDIKEIKEKIGNMATQKDVEDLKHFFSERDKDYTKNMWKVIFGLLILFAALIVAAFGLKTLPNLFGG